MEETLILINNQNISAEVVAEEVGYFNKIVEHYHKYFKSVLGIKKTGEFSDFLMKPSSQAYTPRIAIEDEEALIETGAVQPKKLDYKKKQSL